MPPLYGQYAYSIFSENETQDGLGGSLEGWREFRIRWKSGSDVTVVVDGVESAWLTDEIPVIESSNILLASPGYDPETDYNTYVDFIAAREAATTEPFGVSWGSETYIGSSVQFQSNYNIKSAADFESVYSIDGAISFESVYDILELSKAFTTIVALSPALSVSFRTRVKGCVGIVARFEEIL